MGIVQGTVSDTLLGVVLGVSEFPVCLRMAPGVLTSEESRLVLTVRI